MPTPLFGLTDVASNDPTAYASINFNSRVIEALGRRVIESTALTAPPGSPNDGEVYYVAATATGAWAGEDGRLAVRVNAGWHFVDVWTGMHAWVDSASEQQRFNGTTWVTA